MSVTTRVSNFSFTHKKSVRQFIFLNHKLFYFTRMILFNLSIPNGLRNNTYIEYRFRYNTLYQNHTKIRDLVFSIIAV